MRYISLILWKNFDHLRSRTNRPDIAFGASASSSQSYQSCFMNRTSYQKPRQFCRNTRIGTNCTWWKSNNERVNRIHVTGTSKVGSILHHTYDELWRLEKVRELDYLISFLLLILRSIFAGSSNFLFPLHIRPLAAFVFSFFFSFGLCGKWECCFGSESAMTRLLW